MRRLLLVIAAAVGAIYFFGEPNRDIAPAAGPPPTSASAETYRLVHAIGNDETVLATGLSKRDCDLRKKDNIAVAEALGIHSERLGIGSIACLPESLFQD